MEPAFLTPLPCVRYRGPGQEPEATRICESLHFTSDGTPGVRLVDALNNAPTGLADPLTPFFANAGVKMRYWVGVRIVFALVR